MAAAFAANAADLLRYFARRVADAEDAADLLGDTMETAWRKARAVPEDAVAARMWLFAIARNKLMHHGRSRRRRLAAASVLAQALAADLAAGAAPADDADTAIEVRRAVAALPAELAELVRLIHWDGFTAVEAAGLLGIPAATARSRHARARQLLELALADRKGSQAARIG